MTAPHGHLRVGSVSLASARRAARAAKAVSSAGPKTSASPAVLERYLGHFGSSAGKSAAKKSRSDAPSMKKQSAKKAGARKSVRAAAGRKVSARKGTSTLEKR